ncbi:MAG: rRNA adenine dimethyltransferase family protein, partial [bacterium]
MRDIEYPHRWPRPRRRFAQHFLVDKAVARQIVDLVRPECAERVLEIGPGRGALTRLLVGSLERLVVVEVDRDLAALLRQRFDGPGFRLIEGDVLKLDLCRVAEEENREKLLVVGNLPYNISAPLLFRLIEQANCVSRAVLMLQREVARRLV